MRIKELNLFSRPNHIGNRRFGWFATVRARLYLAFGFAAALTIVCSLVSFYELVEIGATTNEIVSHSLPATVLSLRLAEEASSLVSLSPRLMSSKDDKSRSEVASRIDQQAKNLTLGIERLKELGLLNNSEIDFRRIALLERLTALNHAVTDALTISNERRVLASSIRGAHEALLTALAPAIDDVNFDLMTKNKQTGMDARLNATLESLRRLLEIQSESNLLAGLLTEASLVIDPNRLEPLRDLIAAAQRKIKTNLSAIDDSALQKKLVGLFNQLSVIGSDDGIIALRTYELNRQLDAETAFEAAQSEAVKLKKAVDALVEQQDRTAHDISGFASRQIVSGEIILILLSLAAVIGASFVAWLYVGRSVARRLSLLSDAMRRIADGDLSVQVQDARSDEIADMARALLFFRQATADAAAARQKEIEQVRASNLASNWSKRQLKNSNMRSRISCKPLIMRRLRWIIPRTRWLKAPATISNRRWLQRRPLNKQPRMSRLSLRRLKRSPDRLRILPAGSRTPQRSRVRQPRKRRRYPRPSPVYQRRSTRLGTSANSFVTLRHKQICWRLMQRSRLPAPGTPAAGSRLSLKR